MVETAGPSHFRPEAPAARNISLENLVEIEQPKPIDHQIHSYWRTLGEYVTQFAILRHPIPQDPATARQIYAFLKTEAPGISAAELMPYRMRFEGSGSIKTALIREVRLHLEAKGKKAKKGERAFSSELQEFLKQSSPAEREPFLASLRALFPRDATDDPYLKAINAAEAKARKRRDR